MLAKDQHIDYKRYCFRLSTRDDSKDDRRNDVGPKFDRKICREQAYKSFHLLSEYLENKGVTELFILARETIRFLVKIWCYSEEKKLCQLKIQ